MLTKISRFAAGLFGALLLLIGMRWLIDPAASAQALGMELLDGVGRSTQIGDFASFFVVGGALALIGAIARKPQLLCASAALVLATAVFRTIAWQFHGADFATQPIVAEVVMGITFLFASKQVSGDSA